MLEIIALLLGAIALVLLGAALTRGPRRAPLWVEGKVANYEALGEYLLYLSFEGLILIAQDEGVDVAGALTPDFDRELRARLEARRVPTEIQVDDREPADYY